MEALYKLSEEAQAAMPNMKAMLESEEIDAESSPSVRSQCNPILISTSPTCSSICRRTVLKRQAMSIST